MSMYTYYNTNRNMNMNQSTVPHKYEVPQQEIKQEQNMAPMQETNQYQNMETIQEMNPYQDTCEYEDMYKNMNIEQYQDMNSNQNMEQYKYMNPPKSYIPTCYDLSSRLLKAMTGEREARLYYQELEKMAPSAEDKSIINGFYNDEGKHYSNYSKLYMQITGKQPSLPAPTEPNIPDYISGIKKAIFDETDAYEFYRDTSMCTVNSIAKEIFYEAMTDENEHAIRLNYLYTKNK